MCLYCVSVTQRGNIYVIGIVLGKFVGFISVLMYTICSLHTGYLDA